MHNPLDDESDVGGSDSREQAEAILERYGRSARTRSRSRSRPGSRPSSREDRRPGTGVDTRMDANREDHLSISAENLESRDIIAGGGVRYGG